MGKYGRPRHVTDGKTAHVHCMLDNQGYTDTHSEYKTLTTFPQQHYTRFASHVYYQSAIRLHAAELNVI